MTEKVWLKHYPEQIPHTLTYESVPIQEFLTRSAKKYADHTAIHFMGKEMNYEELYEASLKFANYLKTLGIEKGTE